MNAPFDLPVLKIKTAVAQGKPLDAIKLIRFYTNLDYKQARQCLIDNYGWQPGSHSQKG